MSTEPEKYTHTYYGWGPAGPGDDAVEGVRKAFREVGGPARFGADEDAFFVAVDYDGELADFLVPDVVVTTEREAIRTWWETWAGEPGIDGEERREAQAPGWADAVARALMPD